MAGVAAGAGHTSQMVAFEVINARERTLTDITAEILVRRLHGGSGRRGISGVKEKPPGLRPSGGNEIGVRGGKIGGIGISVGTIKKKSLWGFTSANRYFVILPVEYGMVSSLTSRRSWKIFR